MLEGLLSGDPLGWVDGQHLVDEVFGLRGDSVPLRRRKLEYGSVIDTKVLDMHSACIGVNSLCAFNTAVNRQTKYLTWGIIKSGVEQESSGK